MPVRTPIPIPRLSQEAFGRVAYRLMEHVFAIHADFGRFFDERIYKKELALRMPEARLEMPVDLTHGTFNKRYLLDVLTTEGGLFEFKAAEEISSRHRAQLLNYLLILDLGHGKLVNLRPGEVEHEFVNASMNTAERRQFTVSRGSFLANSPGATAIESVVVPLVEDLGTGLDLALYEEAVTHLLGGEADVLRDVEVSSGDGTALGTQRLRLCAPQAAFKLTTFPEPSGTYTDHCRRLLSHLPLEAVQWVNITNHAVTFMTVGRTTEK